MPAAYEDIEYGVKHEERNPYRSVTALFVRPFAECMVAAKTLLARGAVKELVILGTVAAGASPCFREVTALSNT